MNRLLTSVALGAVLATAGCASAPAAREAAPAAPVVATEIAQDAAPAVAVDTLPVPPADAPVDAPATEGSAATADTNATAAAPAASDAPATPAEDDFAAIYGDAAAPADGQGAGTAVLDPWEPMNRRVHAFNNAIDRAVIRPVARAYVAVVPQPVRAGVTNFFDNLGSPLAFANLLLQGRPGEAVETLGRFLVNTTVGIGGLFDPAGKQLKMHRHSADFGRTLARWGWQQSRYVELPFLGPHTLRDAFGEVGDISMSPLSYVEDDRTRISLQALRLTDLRAGLLSIDALREAAPDEYVLTRDAWLARRRYLVEGDRSHRDEGVDALPEYMMEDEPAATPPAQPTP